MTNALETYLHQIGLVAEMLLSNSKDSDDEVAREDAAASRQLQQQQTLKDASPPSLTGSRSVADGVTLLHTNPTTEPSFVPGTSDLDPVPMAPTIAYYTPKPSYVHSTKATTWSEVESIGRTFLIRDAVVNRHPNSVTTVTVGSCPPELGTKSLHQERNVTQVTHVTSSRGSPPNTIQTLVQCSTNSQDTTQVNGETYGVETIAYPVTQSAQVDPYLLARYQASANSNSMNSKDIAQCSTEGSCLVEVDDSEGPTLKGVIESDSSCDNSLVISIRQNLSDILHLGQEPCDRSQLNRSIQPTTFNRAPTSEYHSSVILPSVRKNLPAADDRQRQSAEPQDAVISPLTLSSAHPSPPSSQSSSDVFQDQPTSMKSSLKKESPPQGIRKAVTFSASDLVHVEEYTISPATPPHDLFSPFDRHLESISEDTDSVLFGGDFAELWAPGTEENCHGSWFNSSTDAEPYLVDDFPSPVDEAKDCAPLSIANDVFGRTTIFLTSGTFRPGESGKLNGKTVSDLSGTQDQRRTLSTGTLSGIRSHRTLVKVNFIQGLLDINHNPGQTVETDSKAVQDKERGINSSLNYCRGIFHGDNLKNSSIKEFPREELAAHRRVDQKICHKLSRYKRQLMVTIVGVFLLLSLAIGLGLGLGLSHPP